MRTARVLLAAALAANLAGCGKSGGGAAPGGGGGSKWDSADACKTLDKSAVASATGQEVKTATTRQSGGSGGGASVSSCLYALSGGLLVLLTRVSPDDMTDAQIASFRDAGGYMKPGVDEPGLGMKAYWMADTRELQVVVDRKRYFSVTYGSALTMPGSSSPAGPDPHAVAVALAKTLL